MNTGPMRALPLAGVRVLDLSRLLPGGVASQMLGDLGADVIKVEEPGLGDYGRLMPPLINGMGLAYLATNRNKRSLALNLKRASGQEVFKRLAAQADVVLESFRPGVLERLGVGYPQLREINPGIIYCAISGYGQYGPYHLRAGHDLNYLGYAGLLSHNREGHALPTMPATQFADIAGGALPAVIGILAALAGRANSSKGRFVDVSMMEGALSLMPLLAATTLNTGQEPAPGAGHLNGGLPAYHVYETKDGKAITLGALEPKFWSTFCERAGRPDLLALHQPTSGEEREEPLTALRALFLTKTRDEWVAEFGEIETCLGPVNSLSEALQDPQVEALGTVRRADYGPSGEFGTLALTPHIEGVPFEVRHAPPTLGEQTREILLASGYTEDDLTRLRDDGAIWWP
ncbi:MAG TPA: CaiB/BaiF CoA-transferase family protein [Ktedonobacterales bacterium]|jgi:crotonobetainyl-CoA:carnitine CoA-transferase CaiB-like acyl-CoA transferase